MDDREPLWIKGFPGSGAVRVVSVPLPSVGSCPRPPTCPRTPPGPRSPAVDDALAQLGSANLGRCRSPTCSTCGSTWRPPGPGSSRPPWRHQGGRRPAVRPPPPAPPAPRPGSAAGPAAPRRRQGRGRAGPGPAHRDDRHRRRTGRRDISRDAAAAVATGMHRLPARARPRQPGGQAQTYLVAQAREFDPGRPGPARQPPHPRPGPRRRARPGTRRSRQADRQYLTVSHAADGSRPLRGQFGPEGGALLDAALQSLSGPVRPRRRQPRPPHPGPTPRRRLSRAARPPRSAAATTCPSTAANPSPSPSTTTADYLATLTPAPTGPMGRPRHRPAGHQPAGPAGSHPARRHPAVPEATPPRPRRLAGHRHPQHRRRRPGHRPDARIVPRPIGAPSSSSRRVAIPRRRPPARVRTAHHTGPPTPAPATRQPSAPRDPPRVVQHVRLARSSTGSSIEVMPPARSRVGHNPRPDRGGNPLPHLRIRQVERAGLAAYGGLPAGSQGPRRHRRQAVFQHRPTEPRSADRPGGPDAAEPPPRQRRAARPRPRSVARPPDSAESAPRARSALGSRPRGSAGGVQLGRPGHRHDLVERQCDNSSNHGRCDRQRDPRGDRRPVPGRRVERRERADRERHRPQRHHQQLRHRLRALPKASR